MKISLSDFVKFYPLRAKNLVWLFGAGSSVLAGVPSAYDFIWDFKRRIYCAEQSYPLELFNNLTDSGIREQIQNYFLGQSDCPTIDSSEEYSYYFERAFPSPQDRSRYIEQQTSGMKLSFGHKVIEVLMKHGYLGLIFTTNFDKAFENVANNCCDKLEKWFCADLESGESGIKFFQQGKRPLIVKLHGDFFSDKIKNTSVELQSQDTRLKDIFSISLDTNGLCVMGYSGRDKSIIELLSGSILKPNSFPGGLYWFVKAGSAPLPEVIELIEKAKSHNKEAAIIEIETFDTAWADIIKGFDDFPKEDTEKLYQHYNRLTHAPVPNVGRKYPLIRINAIPITKYPATARLFKCDAGNTKEIKQLIEKSATPILAIRKRAGVVGFGSDQYFKDIFGHYGSYEEELYQITEKDLRYDDSSMKGLITMALANALTRTRPLRSTKKREKYIVFPDPKRIDDPIFSAFKQMLPNINGQIPNTSLMWVIALEINIQHLLGQPLLVLTPTIIASKTLNRNESLQVAPFVKEFTARWYNSKYDAILNAWLNIFFNDNKVVTVDAFPENTYGVNASFSLSRTTAYTQTI